MAAPLFILSFRHRDELSRLAVEAGWAPIAARRADHAEARFVGSGAAVAIVDARGALEEGLAAVRALAEAAEANAAALLVLLSRTDGGALDEVHRLGGTHFLVSPFSEAQLAHAIQFAARHAERTGGPNAERRTGEDGEAASWRWRPGAREVELSPALARKAGLGAEDGRRIGLMELFRRLDPAGRRAARGAIGRALATGEATAFAHRDEDGGRIAHHVRVRAEGEIVGRAEPIEGERRGGEGRDPLTGTRNARAARHWLEERLAGGESKPVAALLLSVSRYDAINAAFGRAAGDSVLQAAARRIELRVEPDGRSRLVARLGGAQFAVLLAGAAADEAQRLTGELLTTIGRPFVSEGHVITLGARAGIAVSAEGEDGDALLRRAGVALAEARSGEGTPIRGAGEGGDPALLDHGLEIDLRRALDRDEIEIRFQPQVSVTSGAIVGAEALARWIHPAHGELGAATLFAVAERSDYLVQLSDHVQRKAIAAACAWPKALSHLRLAVNVTAADMARPGFAAHFLGAVAESGFPPGRLTVEVTESGLIEDLSAAADLLAALRSGGVRAAIDDFGTGYSSLAYLKALPLDYLKLDKRLSDDITGSPRDRIVVRGVIDMARSLGLAVIAEGVESEAQLGLLAAEGCNFYQGFLCAPPLTAAELGRLVTAPAAAA